MSSRLILSLILPLALASASTSALGQTKGTVDPRPLPALANPNDPATPAKELFGRKALPTRSAPHVVGFYA